MNEKKYLIKSKKQMFLVIGVFALILLLGTTSYAFFNYTRAGSDNSIGTGRINFVSTQSGTTSISNYFPQIPGGASAEQSSLATISVTGGTTFSGGITYYVKLIDVKVGNRAYDPETDVPVNIDVGSYTSLNDTTTNHGTFTPVTGSSVGVGIALSEGVVIANGTIGVADTVANSDNWINGTFTVQAYIPSNVAISDTTGEYESTSYVNGTTTTWVAERRVLTTAQWNALSANPVTFKIQVVANEGSVASAVPTIDSCPNCVYYKFGSDWSETLNLNYDPQDDDGNDATILTENDYDIDYRNTITATRKNFLGLILDSETGEIQRAFACGIHANPSTGVESPYCIEGSTGGEKYDSNSYLLQGEALWNNTCNSDDYNTTCESNTTSALANSYGEATTATATTIYEEGAPYCRVDYDGAIDCGLN